MRKNVKVALNSAAVRDLLRSDPVKSFVKGIADGVASRAGDGYSVDAHIGKNRANASVFAETAKAQRENAQNNTLLRSLK